MFGQPSASTCCCWRPDRACWRTKVMLQPCQGLGIKRELCWVLLGAWASGNEHTDRKPLREHRGSSARCQAKQPLQGTIPPPCRSQLHSWTQQGLAHENHLPGSNRGGLYPPVSSPGAEELLCQTGAVPSQTGQWIFIARAFCFLSV